MKMTEVAEHINSMKKKYDTAIHVQEIQNLIRGHEVSSRETTKNLLKPFFTVTSRIF